MNYYITFFFILISPLFTLNSDEPVDLFIINKKVTVNGKEGNVLGISQKDGTLGLRLKKGDSFNVRLHNTMNVPTSIHWHGLILPNSQDGVAFITQLPLYPRQFYHYRFPLLQSGTYYMHSHYCLQEQKLLSAPLIIYEAEDLDLSKQEAILVLTDFSFKSPSEIYENLRCDCKRKESEMSLGKMRKDIVEVDYDAFLTNYRTLEDPEVILVEKETPIRLRFINASSATNFFISLGELKGQAIAVDGHRIKPLTSNEFELAVAQRIDILVTLPKEGAFPILAKGEGTDKQTGVILKTKGASLPKLALKTENKAGSFTNVQESKLEALYPLKARKVEQSFLVELGGNMANYTWTINGKSWPEISPIVVESGKRVEIIFKNSTTMSHPMHFHGHIFQVVAINGKEVAGAVRDTVLVMPESELTIQFDADNPGVWPLHCHILYHLEAGMLTTVRYKGFIQNLVNLEKEP